MAKKVIKKAVKVVKAEKPADKPSAEWLPGEEKEYKRLSKKAHDIENQGYEERRAAEDAWYEAVDSSPEAKMFVELEKMEFYAPCPNYDKPGDPQKAIAAMRKTIDRVKKIIG